MRGLTTTLRKQGVPFAEISEWHTPATRYPVRKIGSAEIRRGHYEPGVYNMEGVDGKAAFVVTKRIRVTELLIDNKIWMVDDPLHWYGMGGLAEACRGNVLVVGLGLGLIIHWLAAKNPAVTGVTVMERNPDVVRLVRRYLPHHTNKYWLRISAYDFWDWSKRAAIARNGMRPDHFNTAVLDIATSSLHSREATAALLHGGIDALRAAGFRGRALIWGTRNIDLNPAVKPMPPAGQRFVEAIGRMTA